MRSSTETLVTAMRVLARDIQSGDGVANAAIAEAADRLAELERENASLRADMHAHEQINRQLIEDKRRLDWLLTDDGGFWVNWMYQKDEWTPKLKASRDAIDAAKRRGHE